MSKFLPYFLQRKTSLKSLSSCTFHYNRSTPIDRHHRQTASPIATDSRTVASNTVRLSHASQAKTKMGKYDTDPQKSYTHLWWNYILTRIDAGFYGNWLQLGYLHKNYYILIGTLTYILRYVGVLVLSFFKTNKSICLIYIIIIYCSIYTLVVAPIEAKQKKSIESCKLQSLTHRFVSIRSESESC